jgi:drug/metabolite transporter (DMT)-like permease
VPPLYVPVVFPWNHGLSILRFGSAQLGGVIMTVLIPVTEVLAVLFFHEPFNGIKGIAVALSVWGFVSYFYGEIQIHAQSSNKPSNVEKLDL